MSIRTLLLAAITLLVLASSAQAAERVRLVRVDTSANEYRIKNFGDVTSADYPGGFECNFPNYVSQPFPFLAPGELLSGSLGYSVAWSGTFEMGLYRSGLFGSAADMIDYICFGAAGFRSGVAVSAGYWTPGGFLPASGSVYRFVGQAGDVGPSFWRVDNANPTPAIHVQPFGGFPTPVTVGSDDTQALAVHNLGNGLLSITAVGFSGADPGSFTLDASVSLPVAVPVDGQIDLPIVFTPATAGAHTAVLSITSNSFAATVDLSATAEPTTSIELPDGVVFFAAPRPNPTPGRTQFHFTLAAGSHVDLSVVDVRGRVVRSLANRRFEAGAHPIGFDGSDDRGRPLASGQYYAVLSVDGETPRTQKLTVIR